MGNEQSSESGQQNLDQNQQNDQIIEQPLPSQKTNQLSFGGSNQNNVQQQGVNTKPESESYQVDYEQDEKHQLPLDSQTQMRYSHMRDSQSNEYQSQPNTAYFQQQSQSQQQQGLNQQNTNNLKNEAQGNLQRSSYALRNQILQQNQSQQLQEQQNDYFQDQNQDQYQDYNQQRKNQIIYEQLAIENLRQSQKNKKLTQQETDQLVYNLLQKGKEIKYKNEQLKNKYENQEISDCKFQPQSSVTVNQQKSKHDNKVQKNSLNQPSVSKVRLSLAQKKPQRSLQQFLDEQDKFLKKREMEIKQLKIQEEQKEISQFTGKPQLCQESEEMLKFKSEVTNARNLPTYKRLYDLNAKKQKDSKTGVVDNKNTQQELSDQLAFRNNKIKDEAANRLYQDFQRRQEKQKNAQKGINSKKDSTQSNTLNNFADLNKKKNNLSLAKKLLKEFDTNIAILQEEYGKNLSTLDYIQTSEILKMLHFTSEHIRVESSNFIKERSLMNDLWIILQGQFKNEIIGRNLILALMGILGLNVDIPRYKPEDGDKKLQHYQDISSAFENLNGNGMSQQTQEKNKVDRAIPMTRDSDLFEEQQLIRFQQEKNLEEQKALEEQALRESANFQQQNSQQFTHQDQFQQQEDHNQNLNLLQQQAPIQNQSISQFGQMNQYYQQRYHQIEVGRYEEDNLILTDEDIKKLQTYFHIFYLNRLNTSSKNQNKLSRKGQVIDQSQSQLSVKNSYRTDQLANNHRQKLLMAVTNGQNQQISNYDLMMAHRDIKQKNAQMMKEIQEEREMEECTFNPKTLPYNQGNFDTNIQLEQEQGEQQGVQSIKNHKMPMTAQTLGSDRNVTLYKLAKPRSQLRDKVTEEVEYEKNCDECTFKPEITSNRLQNLNRQSQYGRNSQYIKNGDKTVDRLRKAYDKNKKVQTYESRGYEYFSKYPKNQKQSFQSSQQFSRRLDQNKPQYSVQQYQEYTQDQKENQHDYDNENQEYYQPDNYDMHDLEQQQQQQQQIISQNYEDQKEQEDQYYTNNIQYKNQNNSDEIPVSETQKKQINQLLIPDGNYDQYQQSLQKNHLNQGQEDQNNQNFEGHLKNSNDFDNQDSQKDDAPMLYVDVNLSADRVERIVINKGDNIQNIANNFIKQHNLNPNIKDKLIELLSAQINQYMNQE